jgi:methionyl-tRNA formyltransferase
VYAARSLPIGPQTTSGELSREIAELCARMVRDDLGRATSGELCAVPQDEARASFAPPIREAHLRIDFTRSATTIADLVRGMAPVPGAFTTVRGKRLKLLSVRVAGDPVAGVPGEVTLAGRTAQVGTAAGAIEVLVAQLEGKKPLPVADLLNGRVLRHGDRLGDG